MTPAVRVNTEPAWKWLICSGLNLLLGIPAIIPVWLTWYFAVNVPLAALGWTLGNPTENDGPLPWLVVVLPVITLSVLLWWLINRAVARGTGLRGRIYWLVSTVTVLIPSLTCMAASFLP